MILEIDIGNSRVKWRTLSVVDSQLISEGHCTDLDQLLEEKSGKAAEKPSAIRFCSVRGQEIADKLCAWSVSSWNLEAQEAKVSRECAGLSINYPDVSRLGVDRWLAMLAAFKLSKKRNQKSGSKRACLVVDSGTAFTLDAISAEGNHLGGYILPGLKLMQHSLTENTGIRLSPEATQASISLGNSTDEAVLNGSLASLTALLEKQYAELAENTEKPQVFFSGGDANSLQSLANLEESEIVTNLVLDGLAIACPIPDGLISKG